MAPASDPGGQFDVDSGGTVLLVGGLDREAADTHSVLVLAVDQGVPPRTATATLSVSREPSAWCHVCFFARGQDSLPAVIMMAE